MSLVEIIQGKDFSYSKSSKVTIDFELHKTVSDIISTVVQNGDQALIDYTSRFDGVELNSIKVSEEEIENANEKIPADIKPILEEAIHNIRDFHKNQISKSWSQTHEDGTKLGELVRPVDRAGVYVPGGQAFYPSSMIMNAIPAQLAGVESIVVVSPPGKNGLPHELVLGICGMLNIKEVYAIGGAHAVAALAYGTETIKHQLMR